MVALFREDVESLGNEASLKEPGFWVVEPEMRGFFASDLCILVLGLLGCQQGVP